MTLLRRAGAPPPLLLALAAEWLGCAALCQSSGLGAWRWAEAEGAGGDADREATETAAAEAAAAVADPVGWWRLLRAALEPWGSAEWKMKGDAPALVPAPAAVA